MLRSVRCLALAFLCSLPLGTTAWAEVVFPVASEDVGPHCLTVATSAVALGERYPLDKKVVEMGAQGNLLREKMAATSALSRKYLTTLQGKKNPLQEQVTAFLTQTGLISNGKAQWSPAGAQQVASHLERCNTWLVTRPPVLRELPQSEEAAIDHCTLITVTTQNFSVYKGDRSGGVGPLATQLTRNGGEMLGEMQRRGILKPNELRARISQGGDLFEPMFELLVGLKIANIAAMDSLDIKSLRLLDERLRQCHRRMELQMPLS